MAVLNALDPTPEQIQAFLKHAKADQPVYMVNLLKFKDKASYKDGEDISGKEAYGRYAKAFGELARPMGMEVTYGGTANALLIGHGDDIWDAVAIAKYPSAKVMFECVSSEAYRKIHKHRRAGLAGQLLISCDDEKVF